MGKKKELDAKVAKAKKAYEAAMKKFLDSGGVVAPKKVKKERKPKKDPNAPKRPASGYMSWLSANRASIIAKLPAKDKKDVTAIAKAGGVAWKKVTAAEKAKLQKQFKADMAKYEKAMAKYEAGKA